MAAGFERLEPFDVVWIERRNFEEAGLALERTPGRTPIGDLVSHHADAVHLDGTRLVTFATLVATAAREGRASRISRATILRLLQQAIADGRLKAEDLKTDLRRGLAPTQP